MELTERCGHASAEEVSGPLRDRAIRLVQDLLADPGVEVSITGACQRVGAQLGINVDTLRGWVKQAQIDSGAKPGLRSDERRRIAELERENREVSLDQILGSCARGRG